MAKGKGDSGPHFLLCPAARRMHYRQEGWRRAEHVLTKTGRIRHRSNRYGRRHQDEYLCACGRVFWTNYNWSDCPLRIDSKGQCPDK